MSANILPFRLTVAQYACVVQRCEATVRREIRARNIVAEGVPYLIHPRELPAEIDVPLALARLSHAGLLPPAPPTRRATALPSPPPVPA
jgi:hypothetical protein